MKFGDWFSGVCFNMVHRHNLVYNTCWEDPRLDRGRPEPRPDDTVAGHHLGRLQRPRLRAGRRRSASTPST